MCIRTVFATFLVVVIVVVSIVYGYVAVFTHHVLVTMKEDTRSNFGLNKNAMKSGGNKATCLKNNKIKIK